MRPILNSVFSGSILNHIKYTECLTLETKMKKCRLLAFAVSLACANPSGLFAQEAPFKIGLILPLSGPFASTGRQIDAAVKLYIAQSGVTVAGRRVEVVLKDDGGTADTTR